MTVGDFFDHIAITVMMFPLKSTLVLGWQAKLCFEVMQNVVGYTRDDEKARVRFGIA